MKYLNEVKASLHLELMLNYTGLGKNAERQERGLAFAWPYNLRCFSVSCGTKAVVKTSSAQLSRQIPSDSEARISSRHAVW